jgi:hypothetical protein
MLLPNWKYLLPAALLWACCRNPSPAPPPAAEGPVHFRAAYGTPLLDGQGADEVWTGAEWLPLDEVWLGTAPAPEDFSGRYKLAWDENNLYVLAEITDDSLYDQHADGLDRYWDDDCFELFLDEDASGGTHQYDHNAFAYHVALDGRVVDIAPDSSYRYYDDHVTSRRSQQGQTTTWELAVKVYDGKRYEEDGENIPKQLGPGKRLGFMLAYCDNDRSPEREHFIGNMPIPGDDKNRGWIDASLFGGLVLE